MSLKLQKGVKKLVSVLVNSMLVIATGKKAVATAEITKTARISENGKGDKYLRNITQVLYI